MCWLTLSQTWNKETIKLKIILGEFSLRNNFMGNFDEAIDIKGSIIYEANVPPVGLPWKSNSWQHEIEASTWFKNQYGGYSLQN